MSDTEEGDGNTAVNITDKDPYPTFHQGFLV